MPFSTQLLLAQTFLYLSNFFCLFVSQLTLFLHHQLFSMDCYRFVCEICKINIFAAHYLLAFINLTSIPNQWCSLFLSLMFCFDPCVFIQNLHSLKFVYSSLLVLMVGRFRWFRLLLSFIFFSILLFRLNLLNGMMLATTKKKKEWKTWRTTTRNIK